MGRKFRDWSPGQSLMFPPSPADWLPERHLVYFLLDVSEQVDLSPIFKSYESDHGGQPPFHPRMMLVLLLYAYSMGVFSSRRIAERCQSDLAFRVIVGEDIPDFRTISSFRLRHLENLKHLFAEVLRLCHEAGLLKVGRLALDGTKIKSNASRHKAMSYERMTQEEQRLQAEIDQMIKQAASTDQTEDAELGDRQGNEVPAELARRESRLEKIRQAKAALEARAREKALAEAAARAAEGKPAPKTDPQKAVPKPKDQCNFTDPESRIMKSSNKGWDQCGNAQAVVNESQIIVAADVTNQASDSQQVEPMVEQAVENLTAVGSTEQVGSFTADAGYYSETNVDALEANERIKQCYVATGRLKHHEQVPAAPRGRIPQGLSAKEKMARKLRTQRGQKEYARRKAIVEPVFGQIKQGRGFRQFLLRGIQKTKAEWSLICLTHNLTKLFRKSLPVGG